MTQSYISFPNLNLTFNIDRVAFTIGGKEVYWYGIIIAVGFLLAVACGLFLAKKYGMKQDTVIDIVIIAAPVSVICARLYYVAFNWDFYGKHPEEIIRIWNGGIAIYGAVIAAIIVAAVYCKIKKENFGLFCDIGSIGLLIGQSIGRWGNFVNQEAFGVNTDLPWAMTGSGIKRELLDMMIDGIDVDATLPVHPTFLYESLWNFVFLVVFLLLFKKRKYDGQIFAGYLMSYGVGRFFIEGLRTDSLYIGSIRVSQLVAVLCVVAGAVLMIVNLRKKDRKVTLPVGMESEIETDVEAEAAEEETEQENS